MENSAMLKGQRVVSPKGPGEVVEAIGNDVIIKLDTGDTGTFALEDITDDSSAG